MKIIKNMVPSSKYNIKAPYKMTPEHIIIHNTYNDASARNEIAYMIRNNNYTSFHFAVDDKEIIQGIPNNRSTWNAGDGVNGAGNRKGISIEICYSLSGGDRFDKAEINASKLTAKILYDYNWGINKVKKHQDFSSKYCPHRTLDKGWGRFLKMVEEELNRLKKNNKNKTEYPKPPFYAKVTNNILNRRTGPGINYKKLGNLKKEDVYTIVEVKNGWGKLKFDNLGWISLHKNYVKIIESISNELVLNEGDTIKIDGKEYRVESGSIKLKEIE